MLPALVLLVLPVLAGEPGTWLGGAATPIAGTSPTLPSADLRPLLDDLARVDVVGLGEATHGTHEFFELKDRVVRALIATGRPVVFAIEAPAAPADAVDRWVAGADGDPAALVAKLGFWIWDTAEVRSLVAGMRTAKAGGAAITFAGIDPQDPASSAAVVRGLVDRWLPERSVQVAEATAWVGNTPQKNFASVSRSLPGALVAGHPITVSARIRTLEVDGGFASVWVRADGGPGASLAFANGHGEAPGGTNERWSDMSVGVDVPPTTTEVWLGVVHTGAGEAWFDDLTWTVGDEAQPPVRFDDDTLGGLSPQGRPATGPGWLTEVDPKGGEHGGALHTKAPPAVDWDRATADTDQLLADLTAARPRLAERAGPLIADRLLFHARILTQAVRILPAEDWRRNRERDEGMANNVLWLHDHAPPGAIVVVWAHNGHVGTDHGAMGALLRGSLGSTYRAVALTSGAGQYRAVPADGGAIGTFDLQKPPEDAAEATLAATGAPQLLVNLHAAGVPPAFLSAPMLDIGAREVRGNAQFSEASRPQSYDWLLWVAETGPAR